MKERGEGWSRSSALNRNLNFKDASEQRLTSDISPKDFQPQLLDLELPREVLNTSRSLKILREDQSSLQRTASLGSEQYASGFRHE